MIAWKWTTALPVALLLPMVVATADDNLDVFRLHRQLALADISPFQIERRAYTMETIDEFSRLVRFFPGKVVASGQTETFEGYPLLELSDHDGDGVADSYIYRPEPGGDTQHFGWMYDLNQDGRYDWVVFSQGTMLAKPFKLLITYYHTIDSNYDGKADIWVNPDPDLDGDGAVEEGVFAWLYDEDFDGAIDRGEFLGMGLSKAMPCEDDVIAMGCVITKEIKVGERHTLEFGSSLMNDINAVGD